jgi:hypothetical protein
MAVEEDFRVDRMRMFSRFIGAVGALFGLLGILLLYGYVYVAFPLWSPEQLGWWAGISILLGIFFIIGYFIASDQVRTMERESKRKITGK